MEEQYYADRALLRKLISTQPGLSVSQQVAATGRSRSWVKKWRKRLREAPAEDEGVLHGRSRMPKRRRTGVAQAVVERILAIRDTPPEGLQRTPGPKAILYYLARDTGLAAGYRLPRGPSTVWRILRRHGRIARRTRPPHESLPRPAPLTHWQLDFKDISTVKPEPDGRGKRQHVLEVLNLVDAGTSRLVDYHVHADFTAETAIQAIITCLTRQGIPEGVTFDRDPRFVGSWRGQDFPAAWVRLWYALGVRVDICPPRRPDRNPFVERYHRAYQEECLAVHRPTDGELAAQVTARFADHYNHARPNQALSCANRPPCVAFPSLPPRPALPTHVNPDAWLSAFDKRVFVRRIAHNGTFKLDNHTYYVKQLLRGQTVSVQIDAAARQLIIRQRQLVLKRLPLQGLHNDLMALDDYIFLLCREARQEWRRHPRAV